MKNVHFTTYLELDEIDLDKLKKILPMPLDKIIDLESFSVNPNYVDAFDSIECSASLTYDRGSTYDPENSWESWANIDDLEVNIYLDGNYINLVDCLTDKKRDKLEEKFWDRYEED